jgi:hypothetical protein
MILIGLTASPRSGSTSTSGGTRVSAIKYVTVIIDLTPARGKTGPARLLDMVEGRSKAVFKQWLAGRPTAWSKGIEMVAMDGCQTGSPGSRPPPRKNSPTRSR